MSNSIKYFLPVFLVVILAYVLLSTGISGSLYYDDFRPISNLVMVQDNLSALEYITTETSGPLGRPLSMLTFALQAGAWPDNTEQFFVFNIMLHLLSGVLLYLLAVKLFTLIDNNRSYHWPAFFIFVIWVFSPINISTYLIAIQRMAGLSGFFTLLGLLLYVAGLIRVSNKLKYGLALQVFGLVVCSALATLSKENGILLPVLALCIETFLYKGKDKYQKLRLAGMYCAFFIVLSYLIFYAVSSNGVFLNRDFNLAERLLTQPYIILSYLKLALIPDLFAYNPFHDNLTAFTLSTIPLFGLISLCIIITVPIAAFIARKQHPVLSFAIAWFLAAHLLESSVIGLELYFEHRNYIALFGPLFALVFYLNKLCADHKKLIVSGAIAYSALLITITAYAVSAWGRPIFAAEAWYDKQFGSARAAEHLALLYLEQNRTMDAYFTLQAQVKACPDCIGSRVQYALVSCAVNDITSLHENIAEVKKLAPVQKMLGSAPSALASFATQIEHGNCSHITYRELYDINSVLLEHQFEDINASKRFALLINMHGLAEKLGLKAESISYLQQAYQIRYDFNLGNVIYNLLKDVGRNAEANQFFATSLCQPKTANILVKRRIQNDCEAIRLQQLTAETGENNVN